MYSVIFALAYILDLAILITYFTIRACVFTSHLNRCPPALPGSGPNKHLVYESKLQPPSKMEALILKLLTQSALTALMRVWGLLYYFAGPVEV